MIDSIWTFREKVDNQPAETDSCPEIVPGIDQERHVRDAPFLPEPLCLVRRLRRDGDDARPELAELGQPSVYLTEVRLTRQSSVVAQSLDDQPPGLATGMLEQLLHGDAPPLNRPRSGSDLG